MRRCPHSCLAALAVLFWATVQIAFAQAIPADRATAYCINVGQADCTVLEFKCGVVLIDAGSDADHADTVVQFLTDLFERRTDLGRTIQAIYITHPHIDHTRSLRSVIESFNVLRVVDGGDTAGSGIANLKWIRQEVAEHRSNVRLRSIKEEEITGTDGLTDADIDPLKSADCDPQVHVLAGAPEEDPGWPSGAFENFNNHSLVLRIDFGTSSFLFTGDLEKPAIASLVEHYSGTKRLDTDVYHVGHHGSENGTTDDLLTAMSPQIAVISMGKWNDGRKPDGTATSFTTYAYGHPRIEVIRMLEAAIPGFRSQPQSVKVGLKATKFQAYTVNKRVYATGWDGTIRIDFTTDRHYRTTVEGAP